MLFSFGFSFVLTVCKITRNVYGNEQHRCGWGRWIGLDSEMGFMTSTLRTGYIGAKQEQEIRISNTDAHNSNQPYSRVGGWCEGWGDIQPPTESSNTRLGKHELTVDPFILNLLSRSVCGGRVRYAAYGRYCFNGKYTRLC